MTTRVEQTKTRLSAPLLYAIMASFILIVGVFQSWSLAFSLINLCLISALMALGVNMQWGYAGLFNVGVMGFAALGGATAVLVSMPPVEAAVRAGGAGILWSVLILILTAVIAVSVWKKIKTSLRYRYWIMALILAIGYGFMRMVADPATDAIEAVDPSTTGYLGGFGLPILLAWPIGGCVAAAAAWGIGKVSLGLRSDYLAIATLGISEIVIYVLKNEEWMIRGVKNVNGLPRPVPYEVDLQAALWFQDWAQWLGMSVEDASSIFIKVCFALLFLAVIGVVLYFAEVALKSPWGRMMRAIRDNETAAAAMGVDVKWQHLRLFVIGSGVIGLAGAMLTTLDGQFSPTSYQPLRYTFLIWVMVIIGGSGNNFGAILGGFFIWFFWIEAEPIGLWIIDWATAGLEPGDALRKHLLDSAVYMRLMTVGLVLLITLRFAPNGLIPEKNR